MNSFCIYCQGSKSKESIQEIKGCEFKDCPFYPFRFSDIDRDEERDIAVKLLGEVGIKK